MKNPEKLLDLLSQDARLSTAQLAAMTGSSEDEVVSQLKHYEKNGTILGYKALVDWDKTDREYVTALIELKVAPQRDRGFDKVAEKIYNFPEVKSLYLMSGSFDLAVFIEGRTMKEVAYFVAGKLAPLEYIVATATHFVLRKYKDTGVVYGPCEKDERGTL